MDNTPSILHPSFIDPTERDHVMVRGKDALSYLHSQVAQDVQALAVGEAAWDTRARADGEGQHVGTDHSNG